MMLGQKLVKKSAQAFDPKNNTYIPQKIIKWLNVGKAKPGDR